MLINILKVYAKIYSTPSNIQDDEHFFDAFKIVGINTIKLF